MRKTIFIVSALIVLASQAFAQGSQNLVINHFVYDSKGVDSRLVVTDVEGTGPIVNITLYDNDGNRLGTGKELIQPFGKINVSPGKYLSGGGPINGIIKVESQGGNVVGEYWQFYTKTGESWKNTTTLGYDVPGYSKMVCNHFVADPTVESYLVLASASGTDAVVNITFYDDNGQELGKARELVKGNGKAILKPSDFVQGKANGVAFISATGGTITGEYWQTVSKDKYQLAVPMGGM